MSDVAKLNEAAELLAEVESHPTRFVPYARYAASTIPSVPILPTGWRSKPLKFVARLNPEDLNDSSDPDYLLKYVDISNVDYLHGIVDSENYRFEDAPSRARRRVRDGDTIISTVRTYLKAVAQIDNPSEDLIVSTGFAVLRPSSEVNARFLYRAVQSEEFVGRVVAHSTGVSYPAIAPSALGKFEIPLPPLGEQQAIAEFLDRETAKIDSLVAKKRRLIELLGEKRTALISHAVTKGLNPAAPTKPSGIDWLGDVAKHWEFKKLGFMVTMRGGSTPSKGNDAYWKGIIPWVSPKDMKCREIGDSEDHISDLALAETTLMLFEPPVVLMVVRGMILAHSFPVAITTAPVTVNQDMKALMTKRGCSHEYLLNLLMGLSRIILGAVDDSAHGTKVLRLNVWKHIGVFLPDESEQLSICEYIRNTLKQYDGLINRVESAIDRLMEYRSALISAAVTGQIDVRAAAGGEAAA